MSALLFLLIWGGKVRYEATGIYRYIMPKQFTVASNGHAWLLDPDESKILIYGPNGRLLKKIGGRGEGPGEFQYARSLYSVDDQVIVEDIDSVSIFDLSGECLEKILRVGFNHNVAIHKVHKGWVVYSLDAYYGGEHFFKWFPDKGFKDGSVLQVWKPESPLKLSSVQEIKLINDIPFFVTDHQSWFCIRVPGEAKIYRYEIPSLKKRVLSLKPMKVPVDPGWADAQIQSRMRRQKRKMSITVPDFFPEIKQVGKDPLGNLVITRYSKKPNLEIALHFNQQLEQIQPALSRSEWQQVLHLSPESAYVMTYAVDSEMYEITRVNRLDYPDFVARNKLPRHR